MNHHILHIQPNGADSLPWKSSLEAQKLQVLVAKSINDAPTFCRAYALLMVLVDLEPDSEDLTEALSSIRSVCREHPGRTDPPVIGLCGADLTCEQRERFAHMGLDWVAVRSDPEPFVLWHVHILKKLADLSSFEKSQMDVGKLATQTRERLHDLSQPLSAIQGRLQLMAAKCDSEDPNSKCFNDMVRLIFEVSHQIMEIQRLHRTASR